MAPKYKVELVRSFKKPMERQIFEGMRIRNSKAIPINRKKITTTTIIKITIRTTTYLITTRSKHPRKDS